MSSQVFEKRTLNSLYKYPTSHLELDANAQSAKKALKNRRTAAYITLTLKAAIDEDALAALNRSTSRPFDKAKSRCFAVKVINYLGSEVVKASKA